jgi:hypothetical protein
MRVSLTSPAHRRSVKVSVGKKKNMKYEIKDTNITAAAYRYLVAAHQDSRSEYSVTVIYDRIYTIHSLDLRMLVTQFGLKIKEIK